LSTSGVLDDIKKAAKAFLKELRPQDRAMIVTFDWQMQKLSSLTNNRKELESGIKQAKVGKFAGTVLHDSLMDVSRQVLQPIRGRKAIFYHDETITEVRSPRISVSGIGSGRDLLIYYRPEVFRFLDRKVFRAVAGPASLSERPNGPSVRRAKARRHGSSGRTVSI
jgi:hypothetical protein